MSPMNQILLLATCVFLCIIPDGDAVQCRSCTSVEPGSLCLPSVSCTISPKDETCHALKIYYNGELQKKTLSCKLKTLAMCGTKQSFPEKGLHFENICCDNKDFCNELL